MKSMLLAAAVAGIAAIALPAVAQAPTATTTQPSPGHGSEAQSAGEHGGGAMMPGGSGGEMGGQGMGGQGMGGQGMGGGDMMRHMMMHRMIMHRMRMMHPKERCIDRLARRAARYAYIEVELGLTAQQRPLWDKIETIGKAAQQKERALCDQLKAGGAATMLERMDRAQAFLSARLDALQSARPAVQALYQTLTPEQKAIFDRPFRRD